MRRHTRGGVIASTTAAVVIGGAVATAALPSYTHSDLRYLDSGTATGGLLLGLLLAFAGVTGVRAFTLERTPRREIPTSRRRPPIPARSTSPVQGCSIEGLVDHGRRPDPLQDVVPEPLPMHARGCGKRF